MFLDEGFGSLDPETLDTVANAIVELGARGRMVGLITHVSDLAERVPVQYRVTKGPRTSTIERIAV
jgi:exonuclease SbcC